MTWNMSKGLLVFVCGLALLGLAACGGGGGGNPTPTPGGGGGQVRVMPGGSPGSLSCLTEIEGKNISCLHLSRAPSNACEEADAISDDVPLRKVDQCPKTGSDAITSCRVDVGDGFSENFFYHDSVSAIETSRQACELAGGTFTVHAGSSGNGGNQEDPSGGNQDSFPPPTTVRSSPQASGQDLPNIEVAGAGSTTALWVRNGGTGNLLIRAGTWYEPKDGNAQRMIVTESETIAAGQFARVPAACMQRGKPVPPTGLRFFSAAKQISGSVQQCQARCLSGSGSVQNCVWGCESQSQTQASSLTFQFVDRCNDGRNVNFRLWERPRGEDVTSSSRRWPAGGSTWATTGYGRTVTTGALRCPVGGHICYGAQLRTADDRRWSWGVGIDADDGCTDCCFQCPSSGNRQVQPITLGCPS